MLIKIIKYIKGYVWIRVVGYSPERFINLCSNHDIFLWDICNEGDSYTMYLSIQGMRRLKPILKKTKTRTVILERHGLPFFFHKYRKRKVFFGGVILCAILIYVLSLFIWNINIDGNSSVTDDVIIEYLAEQKTYHGIKKTKVNCEKIVSDIRKEYNNIIWASAEIRGTRLLIKVKENTDSKEIEEAASDEPSDLVADKDGIITDIITRSGAPAVGIGSIVTAGDLLVSGRIEVLNDAGEVGEYQYCASDSDIYAKTVYDYEESFSMDYTRKKYTEELKRGFYVTLMDKKITLWDGADKLKECDAVTDEKQLKIGENFYLPFSFGNVEYKGYENENKTYSEEEALEKAQTNLNHYLEELEKKGVQIVENNVNILVENGTCTASGKIQVIEKLGQRTPTEILPNPSEEEERTMEDEHNGNDT